MAGYVKIFTTIKSNPKYLSLRGNCRSVFLQLIISAKEQRDDGSIIYRNMSAFSTDMAYDLRTGRKLLAILQHKCLLKYRENGDGSLVIKLAKYKKWQEIDVKELLQKRYKNAAKIQPLRPDHIIPKQSRPDQEIPFDEIISHLNFVTGRTQEKGFKPDSIIATRNITRSWKVGMRLDDFLYVNQVKAEEWLASDMAKHLNPETLYGNKMEKYRLQRFTNRSLPETELKNVLAGIEFLKEGGYKIDGLGQNEILGSSGEAGGGLLKAAE